MPRVEISSVTAGPFRMSEDGWTVGSISVVLFSPDTFIGSVGLDIDITGDFTSDHDPTSVTFVGAPPFESHTIAVAFKAIGTGSGSVEFQVAGGGALLPPVSRELEAYGVSIFEHNLPHAPPDGGPGLESPNAGIWWRRPEPQPRGRVGGRSGQAWP